MVVVRNMVSAEVSPCCAAIGQCVLCAGCTSTNTHAHSPCEKHAWTCTHGPARTHARKMQEVDGELQNEMRAECSVFGPVVKVTVHSHSDGRASIFVQFATVAHANVARASLHHRSGSRMQRSETGRAASCRRNLEASSINSLLFTRTVFSRRASGCSAGTPSTRTAILESCSRAVRWRRKASCVVNNKTTPRYVLIKHSRGWVAQGHCHRVHRSCATIAQARSHRWPPRPSAYPWT